MKNRFFIAMTTKTKIGSFCLLFIMICCLLSCDSGRKHYHIGMSQCAGGEWREQMNSEVQREVLLHDDIDLDLVISYDDPKQQAHDIDSLVDTGVDVLIVSPYNPTDLVAPIERAFDAGIPVILVDRDIRSDKFSAYISGDNREVGNIAGEYVTSLYNDFKAHHGGKTPTIVELQGSTDITPVKARHLGFTKVMNANGIEFSSRVCNWHRHLAAAVTDSLIDNNLLPAIVYSHNDNMAIGIVERLSERDKVDMIDIVSVDGSPLLGMKLVIDGSIKATVKYPTGGSEAIRTALDILEGRKYDRMQFIKPLVVDGNNAASLRDQETRAIQLTRDILLLGDRLHDYSKRSHWQQIMLITLGFFIIIMCIVFYLYIRKNLANKELQHEVMESITPPHPKEITAETDDRNYASPLENGELNAGVRGAFITSLRDIISQNIGNPNFSVDNMGELLGMGRTQFFSKTKSITGYTPNDLLRTMRLQQAAQLLLTTDHNISDISRKVGFNNPSYFTKAFRDQYKKTPKEYRDNPND